MKMQQNLPELVLQLAGLADEVVPDGVTALRSGERETN